MFRMNKHSKCFVNIVVHLLSHVRLFVTPWTVARQAPLSSTISRRLLKFMSIESVMLSNHLFLCHPLLLLPLIFPTSGSFPMSWLFEIRRPKYWSSTSALFLPMNIQPWFPSGLTGLILQCKGLSRVFITLREIQRVSSVLFSGISNTRYCPSLPDIFCHMGQTGNRGLAAA